MRKPLRRLLALTSAVAVIALGIGLPQPAVAQTDPLVQLLTQKGVLTPGDGDYQEFRARLSGST
jgi:anti-sigma-K factor RskA